MLSKFVLSKLYFCIRKDNEYGRFKLRLECIDSQGLSYNHPELWLRFAEELGMTREEVKERRFLEHTRNSVRILRELSGRSNTAEGLAALYAYESQIPEISTTKIEGLKKFYNLDTKNAIEFFAVHEHADEIHRTVTREALERMCITDDQKQAALDAAREAADAFNLLLDGVYNTWCTEKAALN
jgi:pyrroloquinoline-quinone synthase